MLVVVEDSSGVVVCDNSVVFTAPKNMSLPKAHVSAAVVDAPSSDGSVDIHLTSDAFALYVTLTTLAQGRFEDNAFVMLPGTKTLKFIPFTGFDITELRQSLRLEHAATCMK